tara:strand:- start:202 stop:855 length:654 start_codon:yes stop_codon:yes gene_type:complete
MIKHVELNEKLENYILEHSNEFNPILKEIIDYNQTLGDKKKLQISISQAQLLQTIIKVSNTKKILEIGSFTGFSALSMSLALPVNGSLISLDKDQQICKIAKNFYEKANEKKIKQIIKPALTSLEELTKSNDIFDLIFIDADKENYEKYYDYSVKLLKKNGLIIVDNVLWYGEVSDPSKMDKFTKIIREFNKHVKNDNKTENVIIPLGDGLTICRKL